MVELDSGYDIIKALGEGTYAKVFEIEMHANKERRALKVIHINKDAQELHQKFVRREIEICQKLSHPNIVEIFDVDTSKKDEVRIIMELCDQSLEEYIDQMDESFFSERNVMRIFKDIFEGAKHLFNFNVFHRDFKPANILIKDGVYKITDFGFGKILDDMMEAGLHTRAVGTPLYESIENLTNCKYSSLHDVWSLGVMLYELLFQTLPMGKYMTDFKSKPELIKRIETLNLKFPKPISQELEDILRGMLGVYEKDRLDWLALFNKLDEYYLKEMAGKDMEIE